MFVHHVADEHLPCQKKKKKKDRKKEEEEEEGGKRNSSIDAFGAAANTDD